MSVSYDYQYKDGTTGNTYWQNGDPNSEGKLLGRTDGLDPMLQNYANPTGIGAVTYDAQGQQAPYVPQQTYSNGPNQAQLGGTQTGSKAVVPTPNAANVPPQGGWQAWQGLGAQQPMQGGWQTGQPWWGAGYGPPGGSKGGGGGVAPAPAPAPTWGGSAAPAPAPPSQGAAPAPARENWGGGNGSQIGSAPSGKGKGSAGGYAGGIAPPTINAPYVKPPPPPLTYEQMRLREQQQPGYYMQDYGVGGDGGAGDGAGPGGSGNGDGTGSGDGSY